MATKSKDGINTNVGKRDKVVTPPNSQTKTSSTKPISSSTHKASSSSSSSSSCQASTEKQVPNYLKPTISSRLESALGPKPTLNRRRSFDNKPPSPSRAPNKAVVPERAVQPGRSSSLRTARGTSKPQALHAKSGKKGIGESLVRKEVPSGRGDRKSGPTDSVSREVQASEVADHHHNESDQHHDDQVAQVGPDQDELKSEDHDRHHGVVNDGHDHGHDEVEAEINDIPTVSEELVAKSEDDRKNNAEIEESIDDDNEHEKLESTEVEEEEEEEEKSEDHSEPNETPNDSSNIEANVEGEMVKEEDVKEESEAKLEANKSDNEDENGDQVNGKELGEENSNDQEAKQEAKKGQSGKKEAQIAYNDVIEETASKLLEKKKNKVKALVGAFETVIDYESK